MKFIKQIARAILKEELDKFNALILFKENLIQEKLKSISKLKYPNPDEDYYNNKYAQINRKYKKKFLNKILDLDVRTFVGNCANNDLPTFSGTDDEKAIKILKWVVSKLTYVSDKTNLGLSEYWNASYETIIQKKGDCEDGAILIYDILRKNGIPAWKLRIVCGWAVNPWNGKTDGHAYLTYYSEEYKKWVSLDWCYFPNIEDMFKQPTYKDVGFYGEIWFSFNEDFCWGNKKWF